MKNWFYNEAIIFHMWGAPHIFMLILAFFILIASFTYRNKILTYRKSFCIIIGLLLIISRISLDIWYIFTNQWSVQYALPLELCSIASILAAIMLFTRSKLLFEIIFFIGIGGAIQALLTPDLHFGFPQFRFWQFFMDHTLLILAPLLLIWLYQYQLTWRSVFKAFLAINLTAFIVFILNLKLNANYMFLRTKPSGGSLLDLLGPYPYYIISLEFVAFAVFCILYFIYRLFTKKPFSHITS